ncbi:MAG: sugar-transfer associated ATP-grasp domain-containing protein [Candidatus Zixiibacteriota bacterium]
MNISPTALARFTARVIQGNRALSGVPRISLSRQFAENFRLMRLNGLQPHEYYRYELCRPEITWDQKTRYLSRDQAWLVHRTINHRFDHGVLQKMVFDRVMTSLKIPVPKHFGLYNSLCGYDSENGPLRTREDFVRFLTTGSFAEFVLKAVSAEYGKGIRICRKIGSGRVLSFGEGELSYSELFDKIEATNLGLVVHSPDSWLIQERIIQHPFLDQYTRDCTQTARVVTYITKSGKIQILMRLLKIARSGKHVDNVGATGMAAPFDDSGRLGKGARITPTGIVYYSHHPETNAPIEGEILPMHKEITALALEAQSLLPSLRTVGWDIAITSDGPRLLEGNTFWSHVLQFAAGAGVLTDELFAEIHELA